MTAPEDPRGLRPRLPYGFGAKSLGSEDPSYTTPGDVSIGVPNRSKQTALNELMQLYPCRTDDRLPILSALIQHGARCDLRDGSGTPLERAMAHDCKAFVKVLTSCGAATR
jgi:hypothetical protein